MSEEIKINEVTTNNDNPRFIKDDKFKSLVNSIITFPKMMSIRPITIDENYITLGGNMRYNACKHISQMSKDEVRNDLANVIRLRKQDENYELSDEDYEFINGNLAILNPLFKGIFPSAWILIEEGFTELEKEEFILKDNAQFGEWDFDALANNFEKWQLDEAEIWTPITSDYDLDDFFEEHEKDEKNEDNKDNKITLLYSKEEYDFIQEKLSEKSEDKETIFLNALK